MEESRLREENAKRLQGEMDLIKKQHQEQLKAAQNSAETREMWKQAGHLVGGILSSIPMAVKAFKSQDNPESQDMQRAKPVSFSRTRQTVQVVEVSSDQED